MGQITLTITDTDNPYWRRWDWANRQATTTNLTDANIDPSGTSATAFKFALNPRNSPFGQGTRLARFGLPGKDGLYYQVMGGDALIVKVIGELRNARAGATNYDYSADPTACAIADRDCLAWAQNESVKLTVTLSDGTQLTDVTLSSFDYNIIGTVPEGYVYFFEIIQRVV